jgi:hypothetical protein
MTLCWARHRARGADKGERVGAARPGSDGDDQVQQLAAMTLGLSVEFVATALRYSGHSRCSGAKVPRQISSRRARNAVMTRRCPRFRLQAVDPQCRASTICAHDGTIASRSGERPPDQPPGFRQADLVPCSRTRLRPRCVAKSGAKLSPSLTAEQPATSPRRQLPGRSRGSIASSGKSPARGGALWPC